MPPVSITMKDDAQPIQQPPRKVPLAMKHPFKEELDRMENAGIISKYDSISGPAPEWLNSFVTVRKPNVRGRWVQLLVMSIKFTCRYSSTWCHKRSWSRHQNYEREMGTKGNPNSSHLYRCV